MLFPSLGIKRDAMREVRVCASINQSFETLLYKLPTTTQPSRKEISRPNPSNTGKGPQCSPRILITG